VLLPVLEVRGVLLVDAASFLVSAALLALLPPLARAGDDDRGRPASFLADAGAGLRYLRGQPILRVVVGGYVAVVACTGIDDVALVFLATDTFGAGGSAATLLLAGFAVSSAGNLLTGLAWAGCCWTGPRRGSPSWPPGPPACWPPPWPCGGPGAERLRR
jgi:hypothetical protein